MNTVAWSWGRHSWRLTCFERVTRWLKPSRSHEWPPHSPLVCKIVIMFLCTVPLTARDITVHWSELEPLVKGRKVTVFLTDGKHAKGKVAETRPDELLFKSKRTVPRASVAQIRIRKNYKWGRVIGSAALAVEGATESHQSGTAGRGVNTLVGAGIGFLFGYGVDLVLRYSRVTHIHIAPDVVTDTPHDTLAANFEQ